MRYVLPVMFTALLIGCSTDIPPEVSRADPGEVKEVSVVESDEGSASDSKEIVIDVRSKEEWNTGHVEQAIHIPHTEIAERISEVTDDKDATIIVYCAVGGRAGKAKVELEKLGFTNVENAGGYDDVKQRYQ